MHQKISTLAFCSVVYFKSLRVALVSRGHERSGQGKQMAFAGVLKRMWMPLVVVAVAGGGAYTVSRVRADFGSEPYPHPYARAEDTKLANPKSVVYQVFAPVGTIAGISYFDVNSDPRRVHGARLPWSVTLTVSAPAVAGNVVAQGTATASAAASW